MAELGIDIKVTGRYEATRTIDAIITRLEYPQAAEPILSGILEAEYEDLWDHNFGHGEGYLYETGATKDAFTDSSALGAVRNAHHGGFEFGSNISYNRFFARDLLGPASEPWVLDRLSSALAYYFVPPEDEVKPSWYRPRDPKTGRFMKRR